ncbi:MAG: hypothetical protein EBZ77_10040, partial [Chitinophagia bacterium]|nr:hypothetical protein [Chitinophagia bacterium]
FNSAFGDGIPSSRQVVKFFGDYWSTIYPDDGIISTLGYALKEELRQNFRKLKAFADDHDFNNAQALTYFTHFPLIVPLPLIKRPPIRFGDGFKFGQIINGQTFVYGQASPFWWEVPVPNSLMTVAAACDKPANPNVVLAAPFDVRPAGQPGKLELHVDSVTDLFNVIDTEQGKCVVIWLYMAGFDDLRIQRRFGRYIKNQLPSTQNVVDTCKVSYDSLIQGPSEYKLRKFLSAACQAPIANTQEKVVAIRTNRAVPVVITDKQTAYGNRGAVPVVNVGDTLSPGDFLFDTVKFTDFSNIPAWLTSINIPSTFFGARAGIEIAAGNLSVTYTQKTDFIQIRFPVTGDPADVVKFWADFDNACANSKPSLARRIATLKNIPLVGENDPPISLLPTSVNILELLAKSWFYQALSLSKIKTTYLPKHAGSLLSNVHTVIPAWTSHIVQFDGNAPPGYSPSPCAQ